MSRLSSPSAESSALGRLDHLTFRGNLRENRHGWLRLTPAYSVHLVADLLDKHCLPDSHVLDPFCGTGTTSLVCAERGIPCATTDINPFLLWLTKTKTHVYRAAELAEFVNKAHVVGKAIERENGPLAWAPALHQIEKWWPRASLAALARAMAAIRRIERTSTEACVDLLKIVFCRTMIENAAVSFGHQSMSFKKKSAATAPDRPSPVDLRSVAAAWAGAFRAVSAAAASPIQSRPTPILCDARELGRCLARERYACVISSPPYPNRMSYIRELRPYMYWLGYLRDGREAGELDWRAIGGTWGCATSNVAKWSPPASSRLPFEGFAGIVASIGEKSAVLGRYVEKYFHDMLLHCESLFSVVAAGGSVHYIVGNSKFYDVVLPVEKIYAALFAATGFHDVSVETIRKRSSKKELFEYVVNARKR